MHKAMEVKFSVVFVCLSVLPSGCLFDFEQDYSKSMTGLQ